MFYRNSTWNSREKDAAIIYCKMLIFSHCHSLFLMTVLSKNSDVFFVYLKLFANVFARSLRCSFWRKNSVASFLLFVVQSVLKCPSKVHFHKPLFIKRKRHKSKTKFLFCYFQEYLWIFKLRKVWKTARSVAWKIFEDIEESHV